MRYYFSKLDNEGKEIYKKLYYGMENYEQRIAVKGKIDIDIVSKIYYMILKDNPMMFYVNPVNMAYSQIGDYIWLEPMYIYDKEEAYKKKFKINSILKPLEAKLKTIETKLDREKFINKYLMSNVKYKYNHPKDDLECHTIVGSLIDGYAVCDGISKAFKQLCDLARINCNVISGDSWNEYEKPQKHAWNMAKIDNNWYHIDITWNINLAERFKYVRYDYFNLREIDIIKDHRNFDKLEICNSLKNNFFYENKCILNGKKELDEFLVERFKDIKQNNGSKNIYFKLYCDECENITSLIISAVQEACLKTCFFGVNYVIESNATQNVYLIRTN